MNSQFHDLFYIFAEIMITNNVVSGQQKFEIKIQTKYATFLDSVLLN